MQVTRKLAKAIREEDIPRYRIRDESAKGKTGQDEPRQAIYYQIPYERARKAISCLWESAEFVTCIRISKNVEDGRSLRANSARPISGEAAVSPLPLHPQNSSKQAQ